ncbi:hypothetical protein IAT38_006046 [Cryptococcus sp. DSM 104549]
MRSDEEDEDDDFYDENEEDEEEGGVNGGDGEDEDEAMDEDDEEEGSEDEDGEEDGDGEEDEDEEDAEGDDDDEEEGEGEDEEEEEGSDEEGEGEDVDMTVNGEDERAASPHPSHSSKRTQTIRADLPPPPHLIRRSLFNPAWQGVPSSLSVEAIVGIPLPYAVHSLATSACSSYLLAGSQDGLVRAYDFWASVNGGQLMTAQQRSVVGLGEGVNKAGVPRGWWANEVEGITGGQLAKRAEPVYSMACEGDALWTLAGTQSGPINLFTLRHSPGHLVHTLKGHTSVVSCMALLPDEKGVISGSWDGTVREWDLNTGQTVRTYPTHKAQLSSLSFRPTGHAPSPTPSPRPNEDDETRIADNISVSMGPDFFEKKDSVNTDKEDEKAAEAAVMGDADGAPGTTQNGDAEMAESGSTGTGAIDSLFGDDDADGEGETVPSSILPTPANPSSLALPNPSLQKPKPLSLALPGQARNPAPAPAPTSDPEPPTSASAPLFVPQQAGPSTRQGAADNIPVLSPASWRNYSEDVLLTSSMDGQLVLIDRRVPNYEGSGDGVGRLVAGEKTPPWCMSACWLANGNQVAAGRRNGTVEIWDIRRGSSSSTPNLLQTLRTPPQSGPVSCVVSFQDGRHIATASQDNIRLWNAVELAQPDEAIKRGKHRAPFKIIAGHHGGTVSSMVVDSTCRFLISASGDRGWQGDSTKVVLVHEVKW